MTGKFIGILIFIFCHYFVLEVCCKEKNNNTFIPSDVWQVINNGQAIPAGLHVRINLQTGKKEAKLMDDDKEKSKSALISVNKGEESLDLDKIKAALKEIKEDGLKADVSSDKNFRSYEDLKKDLEDSNLLVKSDLEILRELMTEYLSLSKETVDENDTPDRKSSILTSLEYLVHQYDNAIEFAKLDGISAILLPALNSTSSDDECRSKALLILGSASQSNPQVQKIAVESGCVSFLLKFLASEKNVTFRARTIYALSCLVRSFPLAQSKLMLEGGIAVLCDVFDDSKYSNEIIRRKIAIFLSDLVREANDSKEPGNIEGKAQMYERIGLKQVLREQGWCQRVADWLCRQIRWEDVGKMAEDDVDHEVIDVAVSLMLPMSDTCLEDFVTNIELHNVVNHVKQFYNDLVLKEMDEGVSDTFYAENLKKLRILAAILARTTKYKDEL